LRITARRNRGIPLSSALLGGSSVKIEGGAESQRAAGLDPRRLRAPARSAHRNLQVAPRFKILAATRGRAVLVAKKTSRSRPAPPAPPVPVAVKPPLGPGAAQAGPRLALRRRPHDYFPWLQAWTPSLHSRMFG